MICKGVNAMSDKKQEFIKILSDPDTIASKTFKSNPKKRYVDANDMVYWIVEEANKVLEEEQ